MLLMPPAPGAVGTFLGWHFYDRGCLPIGPTNAADYDGTGARITVGGSAPRIPLR